MAPRRPASGITTFAAFDPTVRYLPGSVLAITYYDLRDYVTGSSVLNTDAWLTESSDGGATWEAETQITKTLDAFKPFVAVSGSGNAVHLIWYDNRMGNPEIYYRKMWVKKKVK